MTTTPALHFKQFGRYEIIRKLGRSMTDVYLALDPENARRVVLKIVEHSHDAYTQNHFVFELLLLNNPLHFLSGLFAQCHCHSR